MCVRCCRNCHGATLAGGPIAEAPPGTVPASDLTPGGIAGMYTEAQFVAELRTGRRPGGAPLNEFMPWRYVGQLTDAELHAVWRTTSSNCPTRFSKNTVNCRMAG